MYLCTYFQCSLLTLLGKNILEIIETTADLNHVKTRFWNFTAWHKDHPSLLWLCLCPITTWLELVTVMTQESPTFLANNGSLRHFLSSNLPRGQKLVGNLGPLLRNISPLMLKLFLNSRSICNNVLILQKKIYTGGPRIVWKFVPKFLHAIRNAAVWIYTSVRAENHAIARNCTNFTLKLNILRPKN